MDCSMNTQNDITMEQFRVIGPEDMDDYRERAGDIAEAAWPEFMMHDPVANENWHELFDRFPEYQFALHDVEADRMAAMGNSLPFRWEDDLANLPERGWDWVFEKAVQDHKAGVRPNIQSAIQVAIHPEYQGRALSSRMVDAMRRIGQRKGFEYLVAPVRPSQKSRYPLISIDDYVKWRNEESLPFDSWLRVHARLGARIIKPCHEAMTIPGSRAEWEAWTGMKFPQSGAYVIPGALRPMNFDLAADTGVYIEPNVWMAHRIRESG